MGVAHHRKDRRSVLQRRQARHGRERAGRRDHGRQHALRDAEQLEQLGMPAAGLDVEQLRARGIARLDHVVAAQTAQQPRVHRAQAQLAVSAARAVGIVRVEQPGGFRRREHRIDGEAAQRADAVAGALPAQARAVRRRSLVLPAQQGADSIPAAALPEHERLALRAQADGGDGCGVVPGKAIRHGRPHAVPDLSRRLLDPGGLRVRLADGGRGARDDLPVGIDEYRLRGARALIDREQHRITRLGGPGPRVRRGRCRPR